MGHVRNSMIAVTGNDYQEHTIREAHAKAKEIFSLPVGMHGSFSLVTEITPPAMNGVMSFFIAPDGSKEGWGVSGEFDIRRDAFVKYLESTRYDDGSHSLEWVEVQYHDDYEDDKIVRGSRYGN